MTTKTLGQQIPVDVEPPETPAPDPEDALTEVEEAISLALEAREQGQHDVADGYLAFVNAFDTGRLPADKVSGIVDAILAIPKRPDPEAEAKPKRRSRKAAPPKVDVSAAFDAGARLDLPEPTANDPGGSPETPAESRRKRTPRQTASTPTAARPAGSDEFTGLFAAGLITLIAFTLGDEFQPTEQEATELARPLGNIMSRRIDLAAKLGQDANDIVAFSIALMAYGVRVGPIAAGKARQWNDTRTSRTRGRSGVLPGGLGDPAGTGGMAVGEDDGSSTFDGTPFDPFHAIAKVGGVGRGVIGRDLGQPANGRTSLAPNGSDA